MLNYLGPQLSYRSIITNPSYHHKHHNNHHHNNDVDDDNENGTEINDNHDDVKDEESYIESTKSCRSLLNGNGNDIDGGRMTRKVQISMQSNDFLVHFNESFRSGTSSYRAYLQLFIDGMEDHSFQSFTQQGLMNNEESNEVMRMAFTLIETIFIKSCEALVISPETISLENTSSSSASIPPNPIERIEDENDLDDCDWFFQDDNPIPIETEIAAISKPSDLIEDSEDVTKQLHLSVWSDLWLAIGLQHCLPFDYSAPIADSFDQFGCYQVCKCIRCALLVQKLSHPMALAFHVATGTNDNYSNRCLASPTFSCLLASMLHSQQMGAGDDREDGLNLDLLSGIQMGNVNILRCFGVSSRHTTAAPRSVFIPVVWRDFEIVASSCDPETSMIRNIAIIDCSFIQPGRHGEGGGLSEEGASIKSNYVLSSSSKDSDEIKSLVMGATSRSVEIYIRRIIEILTELEVRMIIVSDTNINTAIRDACTAQGVAVLSVHSRQIPALTKLLKVRPVEDILDLCHLHVSSHPISVNATKVRSTGEHSQSISFGSDMNLFAATSHVEGEVKFEFGRKEVAAVLQLQSLPVHNIVASSPVVIHRNLMSDPQPSSILFCAPSEYISSAIEDRFARCLYRLRAVQNGGRVILGAGMVECLFYLELESLKYRIQAGNLSHQLLDTRGVLLYDYDVSKLRDPILSVALVVAIVECAQRVMLNYLSAICDGNGIPRSRIDDALEVLSRVFSDPAGPLAHLSCFSNGHKLSLPSPLNLGYEDHRESGSVDRVPVLDILEIKVNSFQSALGCWELIFQANCI